MVYSSCLDVQLDNHSNHPNTKFDIHFIPSYYVQ